MRYLCWAAFYTAALAVAQLPGDPEGDVPPAWLVVISFLAWSSWRGSTWARACFVVLQALFLTTFLALAWPVPAQLCAFYSLLALALLAVVARLPRPAGHDGGVALTTARAVE